MHAVIFDIDGTLVRSVDIDDRLYRESVRAILGPVEFRPELSDYENVSDSGILAQLLEDNGLVDLPDPTTAIKTRFVAELERYIAQYGDFTAIPGAADILMTLRESSEHAVAIATGGWLASAELKLRSAGLDVERIPLASADVARDRTDIMRAALDRIGSAFASITYYGDGPWDRDACLRLGWDFVAVGTALNGIETFNGIRIHE